MKPCVAACVLVSACASSPPSPGAPAAAPGEPGRAERLPIDGLEAYALEDGHLVVPNDGQLLGFGRPPDEIAALLVAAGVPGDSIRLDIQCLLVKAGDRVILFDAGTGEVAWADAGRLPRSLARAGVEPGEVTDVFISHAHSDHVGGLLTAAGAPAFPRATIHLSTPEWASVVAATDDPEATRLVAAIGGAVATFEPGAQVLPIVTALATPGHTPGHSSYRIGAGPDPLIYLGDVAHHAVISVQRPAWSIAVDADRPAAEAMRQQTLARLAAERRRVFVPHFPYPGAGQVVADGGGLRWRPQRE